MPIDHPPSPPTRRFLHVAAGIVITVALVCGPGSGRPLVPMSGSGLGAPPARRTTAPPVPAAEVRVPAVGDAAAPGPARPADPTSGAETPEAEMAAPATPPVAPPVVPLAEAGEIELHLEAVVSAADPAVGEPVALVTLVADDAGGLTVEHHPLTDPAALATVAAEVASSGELVAAGVDDVVQLVEPAPDDATGSGADDTWRPSQWALDRVPFEAAWASSNGTGITVAVIDTAVDVTHPELASRITGAHHFRSTGSGPGFEFATPGNFHGTHVAGIIAAVAGNAAGITGAAPGVRIMPIEVLGSNGSGRYSDITSAVVHATDQGARVINLSLGGNAVFAPLDAAIAYAEQRGVVVMAAAGNDGCHVGFDAGCSPVYPAASPYSVAVGSVDADLDCSSFTTRASYVELGAPGGSIYSTAPFATHPSGYATASGTSMAAPYASAAAAIVLGRSPALSAAQVRSLLIGSAVDVAEPGTDSCTGSGLIDPVAALDGLGAGGPGSPPAGTPSGPLGPPRLAGLLAGRGMVRLSFVAPTGAELLSIHRDGVLIASIDAVRRSFTDRAVNPRTTYAYEVVAWSSAWGDSAASGERSVTTRG